MTPRATLWAAIFVCVVFGSAVHAQRVSPIEERIDAIIDRALVVPVRVSPGTKLREPIRVRLDDGRELTSELALVRSTPPPTRARPPWSGDTRTWSVERASAYGTPEDTPPGAYVLIAALPVDAVGQGIWIDGERHEPNWLPAPQRVILESSRADDGFWDPALTPEQLASPLVARAVERMRANPIDRWRAELVAEGFSPERADRTTPRDTQRELDAVFAELEQDDAGSLADTLAESYRARWQLILGRLELVDPPTARDLKHTLTRTATVNGRAVPLWNDDRATLALLAHDLLSPFVDDELRVERVRGWLDTQDQSIAWVIDDAGDAVTPGLLIPSIGVIDARRTTGPITARVAAPGVDPVIARLEPDTVNELRVPVPAPSAYPYQSVETYGTLRVQAARDTHTLRTQRVVRTVAPPGAPIGPLLSDWTLRSLAGRDPSIGALPPPDRRVTGVLTRSAPAGTPGHRAGWRVHIDCVAPDENAPTSIKVWVGPRGAARAVWTVSSEHGLTESRMDSLVSQEPRIETARAGGVWSVSITIPSLLIDDTGVLLLGVERIDRDHHSAWPRRMTPWDDEPGRAAFDLTGWIGTTD